MAKIYVGNLPFTREGESISDPVAPGAGKKFFEGQLREGLPTSVLPKGVRQELDEKKYGALTDFLRSAKSDS